MSEHESPRRLGWIGLGSMGSVMAKNMQKHISASEELPALKVFNRTASRLAPVVALGAVACQSIPEVVSGSDIVFISTSDDAALERIIDHIIQASGLEGKIIVDTTTVHPRTASMAAQRLGDVGVTMVAAPCFGATPVAEEGRLLMAVAGPQKAADEIENLIKGVLARDVLRCGEDHSKALLLKTSGNFIIAGIMEVIGEALVFAEKTGLGTDILQKLIEANFGRLAFSNSQRMTQGVYMPGEGEAPWSDLNLALKDVGHGLSSAAEAKVKLRTGEVIMQNLERAKAYSDSRGGRSMDSSSLYGVIRMDSGLDFETDYVKQRDGQQC